MKFNFAIVVVFILSLFSCNKDSDKLEYQTVMVKVYTGHDRYAVVEPVFETFFEQMLSKEAHNEGATFEIVMEQVLDVEGYTQIDIIDQEHIDLITNLQKGETEQVPCVTSLDPDDFIFREIPSSYISRSYQRVLTNGTGVEIPAEYETRSFERLDTDSQIIDLNSIDREYTVVNFVIPRNMEFSQYIKDQLSEQQVFDCLSNQDYEIVD